MAEMKREGILCNFCSLIQMASEKEGASSSGGGSSETTTEGEATEATDDKKEK